mgnify:CR=1 FL=1
MPQEPNITIEDMDNAPGTDPGAVPVDPNAELEKLRIEFSRVSEEKYALET